MPNLKRLGVLTAAILALSALVAANASATAFTANAAGTIAGSAVSPQEFTISNGTVKCNTATVNGNIGAKEVTQLTMIINYGGCNAFGFANTNVSPAEVTYTPSIPSCNSSGSVNGSSCTSMTSCNNSGSSSCNRLSYFYDVLHSYSIKIASSCEIVIPIQTVSSASFSNSEKSVTERSALTAIKSNGTGSFCTASNNGTLNGELSISSSGSLSYDP